MVSTLSMLSLIGVAGLAVVLDLRARRIPNVLTYSGLALALALRSFEGPGALAAGLAGVGIALAIALPLFALGAFGGGDGKLLMAVGAFLGPQGLPTALLVTALVGGAMSLLEVMRRGVLLPTLLNMRLALTGRGAGGIGTIATPGSITIPYGVAIAVGALAGWFA
jgi:prepilin peptidase CpaA